MTDLSRRQFITTMATAAAVAGLAKVVKGANPTATQPTTQPAEPATLRWLEAPPTHHAGITCTVPWPRGTLAEGTSLRITNETGEGQPAQSWPIGYWPDGSLKWTAHALAPSSVVSPHYHVTPGDPLNPSQPLTITDTPEVIEIDTGIIRCRIPRAGPSVIENIIRAGRTSLTNGQLICLRQDNPQWDDTGTRTRESFQSITQSAAVENAGPVRAVIKVEGVHRNDANRNWLPFTLRLYFYAGSDQVRIVHTFIFDGDETKDFIAGIGLRFQVPMTDPLYNRHVRFVGEGPGMFAEAVRTVTGLRRDPGDAVRKSQIDGVATPPLSQWDQRVASRLDLIPAWGDFILSQLSADGFQIRKRTKPGCGWTAAATGTRAGGVGYLGGVGGGVAIGMRDFWQKHPAQIDLRNAHTDLAQVTLWLWSPDAPAMDMRFYHDGMGEDTYPKQQEGLNITYEDFEPGYAKPYGIARTSEMNLWITPATPSRADLVSFADSVRLPPILVCEPQRYLDAKVFGAIWTLPDRSTPAKSLVEDELAFYLDRYLVEINQRSWYGFWDYGDVRHAYDSDRHEWRYDVGGYAWDNSELSTDLWLWYSYLRTGRANVFRMAEAMTRHTGEVDVYHIGPFKGLGTRHGVQHWGDSSKQTRISSAIFRRPYYFLTGDERVGDLLRDQLTEGETWITNDVGRKLGGPPHAPPTRDKAPWGAMSWGELASAWLAEIERTRDAKIQEKLLNSMRSIAAMPFGFCTAGAHMDLDTGIVTAGDGAVSLDHLASVFGLPEICAELSLTYGDQIPTFADAWSQYGYVYNASQAERKQVLGVSPKYDGLRPDHSRCTAFAAWHRNDPKLAERAWHEFIDGRTPAQRQATFVVRHITGPDVLNPIDEADLMTNNTSQRSLAAMQNLALVGDAIEATMMDVPPAAATGPVNGA